MLFELNRTLEQYNNMTWAEYTLCREGWIRNNIRQWEHTRHISYYEYLSIPDKHPKKSILHFMPLPNDKTQNKGVVNEETRNVLREMQLEYLNKVNNKK